MTRRRLALAALSGLLLLAAFPPLDLWWTAPLGTALLVANLRGLPARRAYLITLLTYLVLFLPLLEWTRYVGVGPWLALALLEAAIAAVLGPVLVLLERLLGRHQHAHHPIGPVSMGSPGRSDLSGQSGRWQRVVDSPFGRHVWWQVWWGLGVIGAVVAVEAVRARVPFGGLTWGRLAFGQSDSPLLGVAAWGGAPLVSASVVLAALAVLAAGDAARRADLRGSAMSAVVLLLVLALAGGVPTPTDGARLQVAAVQGNVPRAGIDAFAEDLVVLDNHLEQTRALARDVAAGRRPAPDLVIWPENAADQDPRSEPQTRQRLDQAAAALGSPFLVGALLREGSPTDRKTSNALLVWGASGVQGPIYRKRHLVPFGEYLPWRTFVEQIYPDAATLLPRDFTPGDEVGLLRLNGVPLAVGTCFEVAFDGLARQGVRAGGELLVLPSNNASYGRSAQSAQQLAMARLRAVEHGRSTVVATTSGISALIEPDGRVVARSGLYEPAVLSASLPRRTALTFATRHGAAVELTLVLLLLAAAAALAAGGRGSRRARRGDSGAAAGSESSSERAGATA